MKIQVEGRFPSHVSSKLQSVPPSQHANNFNALVFINFSVSAFTLDTDRTAAAGDCGRLDHFGRLLSAKVHLCPNDYQQSRRRPAGNHLHHQSEGVQLGAFRYHQLCLTLSAAAAGHDREYRTPPNAMIYPHTSFTLSFNFFFFCFRSHQVLYSRIAIALWKSSRGLERHIALQNTTSSNYSNNFNRKPSSKYEKRAVGVTESQVGMAFFGNDEGTQIQLDRAFVLGR